MVMRAIKISTVRKNEPLITVAETPEGIRVVEGNPELFDRLGLSKYKDLDGILRGVHRSSELKAEEINEKGETAQQPQSAPEVTAVKIPEFEEKIKGPLDILNRLLDSFRSHSKTEAQKQQTQSDLKAAQKAPEEEEKSGTYFVSFDGDNIGKKAESVERKGDEKAVTKLSDAIKRGGQTAKDWAQQNQGEVIEQGGDEGLIKVPAKALKDLDAFRSSYNQIVKATLTIGVGKTISEATKARELGKLRGKNCVVYFDENTEQELKLKLDQKDQPEKPEEEDFSTKYYDETSSHGAVEQMIKELIEDGYSQEEIAAELKEHGLDDYPGIQDLVQQLMGVQSPKAEQPEAKKPEPAPAKTPKKPSGFPIVDENGELAEEKPVSDGGRERYKKLSKTVYGDAKKENYNPKMIMHILQQILKG